MNVGHFNSILFIPEENVAYGLALLVDLQLQDIS